MPEIQDYLRDHRFSEIISNLHASACITPRPCTLSKDDLMSDAKELMRKKKVSSIPIVNGDSELVGLVSIEDIIISLEEGYLNESISKHMTKKLVTLNINDSMNSILEKFLIYPYGRFPVVDEGNTLVGIITKGDIALCILKQLGNIYLHYKRRDDILTVDKDIHSLEMLGKDQCYIYAIDNLDLDRAGEGAAELKRFLENKNYAKEITQKVSISAYEAEVNVVIHAKGKGNIKLYTTPDIIFLFVDDDGPGITDVELAMQEGFSTASDEIREHGFGAGMGLPNMKKYADKLIILSDRTGTKIEMLFLINPLYVRDE